MPGRNLVLVLLLLPVVYLIGSLLLYAFRSLVLHDAPVDEELAARGRSAILGTTIRQGFAWCAGPVEQLVLRRGISADTLTMSGCAACSTGAAVIAAGDLTIGGIIVLQSAAFDFLDGRIARRRGTVGRAGEFFDSTLDRYSDAFCFASAAFYFREQPAHLLASLVAMGAAAIVPYTRAKAEALGTDLKIGLMQRPERLVLFSGAAMFAASLDTLWPGAFAYSPTFALAIWVLALGTAWTAVVRTREGRVRLRRSAGAGENFRPTSTNVAGPAAGEHSS
ncbi:MAG TPA: CDP-alcohol phosphatidyltransferase family protein [Candidatus Limnocylindrales bacterium]|nr:CDP-alcohol phosphatidyltransferase family protein [Candidatus Limnocylindrales bacterium]